MCAVRNILEDDFKESFWITDVIKNFEWWQKKVFIVKIWDKIQVLKIFINFSKRDIRELDIYEKFKDNWFLPKVINVIEYKWDTIVFEELIDWLTLEECKNDYLWNEELILDLIRNIIEVLNPLWEEDIIHRDIKPSNIIISKWKPYVIDFWVAKNFNLSSLTDAWFQPWTRIFMSPEQMLWKNNLISQKSDFFSLGVLIYYLYYWELPFWNNPEEIKNMIDKWVLVFKLNDNCSLNNFFKWILQLKPYLRPRNKEILLSLLP